MNLNNNSSYDNWKQIKLKEISIITSGGTPSRKNTEYYGGNIPWLKSGELNDAYIFETEETITEKGLANSSAKLIPKGTLLVALYGATAGKTAILGIDSSTNQAISSIMSKNSNFIAEYIRHFFIYKRNELLKQRYGGAQPNLSQGILKNMTIPLPPIEEQKLIINKIEELFAKLDAGVESLKRTKTQLERYRQSLLKTAFEGKLTEKWRNEKVITNKLLFSKNTTLTLINKYKKDRKEFNLKIIDPSKFDKNTLPSLPRGWIWTQIGAISVIVRGGSPRPAGDPRYFGGKIPWITVGEITKNNTIFLRKVKKYVTDEGKKRSRFITTGTLLLTNSGATLGVPKISKINGCINDGVVAILIKDDFLKYFLYYFLCSKTLHLRQVNQGVGQPNLNTKIIREIVIPFPPLIEQKKIIEVIEAKLSIANKLIHPIIRNIEYTDNLKYSILNSAFKGKLIAQNFEDDSIDVLTIENINKKKIINNDSGKEEKIETKQLRLADFE